MNQPVPVRPYGFLLLLKLLGFAAADERLSRGDLQTLVVLTGFSSQHYEARVSQGRIASQFGISRQAAQKRIRRIVTLGYLSSTSNSLSDGRAASNTYRFNVELVGFGGKEAATSQDCSGGNLIELSISNCTQVAQRKSFRESRVDMERKTRRTATSATCRDVTAPCGKEALSDRAKAEAISKIEERLRCLDPPFRTRTIPPSIWVRAIRLAVNDLEDAIQLLTTWKGVE